MTLVTVVSATGGASAVGAPSRRRIEGRVAAAAGAEVADAVVTGSVGASVLHLEIAPESAD